MQQVLQIARSIAGETGHALLANLTSALSKYLNTAFVAITYGEGTPPTHARATYALRHQEVADDVRYELDGTPCARVYRGEALTIPCGIAKLYPREAAFEGYIGIPLRDRHGEVGGHLAVFSDDPIEQSEVAAAVTTIFAIRAEAEMRRIAEERERQNMISDLSALNARLLRGYAKLKEENAQKTSLMGLIAHDLRSPLSAVLSQAELGRARIGRDANDLTKLDSGFRKIADNACRMADLIEATLERVRAEGEALMICAESYDLSGLARIAVEANREAADGKGIALSLTCSGQCVADVDDALIVSAIDNLVSNAIKYTFPGGNILVALSTSEGKARVSVTDTGQGMTSDDLQRAFGRFQRLSARPTGGEHSTGLGLANVREIALAHGGEVLVESGGRGKGSRFTIVVPEALHRKGVTR